MKFSRAIPLICLGAMLAAPAFALDLQTARMQGLVGEQTSGYVAIIKASPDVQKLVADVNAKRTQEYENISKQNGQPVPIVAKLAAEQIINNLPAGSMYQDAGGSWKTR